LAKQNGKRPESNLRTLFVKKDAVLMSRSLLISFVVFSQEKEKKNYALKHKSMIHFPFKIFENIMKCLFWQIEIYAF